MSRRYCHACDMLKRGVKFRKSPTHTCDEFKVKTVKFPKLKEHDLYDLYVQRTGMIETKNALMVRCVKQKIEGVVIPNGLEIWIPSIGITSVHNSFSSNPFVHIPGWKLQGVLKMIVMEGLRNG